MEKLRELNKTLRDIDLFIIKKSYFSLLDCIIDRKILVINRWFVKNIILDWLKCSHKISQYNLQGVPGGHLFIIDLIEKKKGKFVWKVWKD